MNNRLYYFQYKDGNIRKDRHDLMTHVLRREMYDVDFPFLLYDLIESCHHEAPHIASWNMNDSSDDDDDNNGNGFIIKDKDLLETTIFPNYFASGTIDTYDYGHGSFVHTLDRFGFISSSSSSNNNNVTTTTTTTATMSQQSSDSSSSSSSKEEILFLHKGNRFQKDRCDLLEYIVKDESCDTNFPYLLYDFVQDCDQNAPHVASWYTDSIFILKDKTTIEEIYGGKDFSGFVRNLNHYSFQNVTSKTFPRNKVWSCYMHREGNFKRCRPDLLKHVKRKQKTITNNTMMMTTADATTTRKRAQLLQPQLRPKDESSIMMVRRKKQKSNYYKDSDSIKKCQTTQEKNKCLQNMFVEFMNRIEKEDDVKLSAKIQEVLGKMKQDGFPIDDVLTPTTSSSSIITTKQENAIEHNIPTTIMKQQDMLNSSENSNEIANILLLLK